MNNDVDDFIEDITTNFSELFIETFFLRYLINYNKKDLLDNVIFAKNELFKKIDNKISTKLKSINLNK